MKLYAGLDFHSRNTYIGIMDNALNRVFKRLVSYNLDQYSNFKAPQKRLKGPNDKLTRPYGAHLHFGRSG